MNALERPSLLLSISKAVATVITSSVTRFHWSRESEETFWFSCQANTCQTANHTQWRLLLPVPCQIHDPAPTTTVLAHF